MRHIIKDFVQICVEELPILTPVYEFGSLQVPGQVGFADLRPYFIGKEYVGVCMDTLEHVEYPRIALSEIYRILKPGGLVMLSSVMNFVIHEHPSDYWRFTPEGFKSLLKPFEFSLVEWAGEELHPHTVVGIGIKGEVSQSDLKGFKEKLAAWKEKSFIEY